ncbi:MAG: ABC transporter permease, partial [Lachnospiraceae bacterium]|nr:ABC transporter permease [Lachnospiraceae bacterium]
MFRFIFQKLLNKKWLILSILIGNILLVGIACCSPMYSHAALQKMLTKRMNAYLEKNNSYPGMLTLDTTLSNTTLEKNHSNYFDDYLTVADKTEEMFGQKADEKVTFLSMAFVQNAKFEVSRSGNSGLKLKLASLSNLEDHVDIVAGRMYSDTPEEDGIIECVINEKVYLTSNIILDDVIEIYSYKTLDGADIRIRVVGVFRASEQEDIYWVNDPLSYQQEFFIPQNLFVSSFLDGERVSGSIRANYHILYNYEDIETEQVEKMLSVYRDLKEDYDNPNCLYTPYCNYNEIFEQFLKDSSKVKSTIWILQVPVLVLLAVFIFMVSNQVIDIEQGEIAMMKSRGVSRLQLLLMYLLQSTILGAIAIIVGIPFGYLLCHVFGSTNAFLEFVGRRSMNVRITSEAIKYALVSCASGILIMTLPVLKYARFS